MCEVADRLVNKGLEQGRIEGRIEGQREGRIEGQSILATLINRLLAAGKTDDAMRATTDEDFREKLYKQYGIG